MTSNDPLTSITIWPVSIFFLFSLQKSNPFYIFFTIYGFLENKLELLFWRSLCLICCQFKTISSPAVKSPNDDVIELAGIISSVIRSQVAKLKKPYQFVKNYLVGGMSRNLCVGFLRVECRVSKIEYSNCCYDWSKMIRFRILISPKLTPKKIGTWFNYSVRWFPFE